MKDKKILYGIIIAFIFLLSIGLTYAYFSVTSNVNGDRNDMRANAGVLSILYTDGPEIVVNNIQPGWTTTKTIKVKNTGTLKAFYSIAWASLTNEIENDELVLSATCTSDNGTCDNIVSKPVTNAKIVPREEIKPGEEQTYIITFEFKEISSMQNYNQGKKFNGVLNVIDENESFTVAGTLLDVNGNPISGATVEIHSEVRTGTTDTNGKFEIKDVVVGTHEIIFKNSSNEVIATDTIKLISSNTEKTSGKEITANTDKGIVETLIKLNSSSSISEIKLDYTLKGKILRENTLYADNVSSTYVSSASGVDFTNKSSLTNGQGLYTNNKLEDGKNTYFRGGSFCAYTNYNIEDASGTYCTAAGGTWNSTYKSCSLNINRTTCSTQGFTYYDLKNNVTFAGHKWKIIRIDENNNIRMVLADDNVSTVKYNVSDWDNAQVGYMYGLVPSTTYENAHANTNNSTIKLSVDSWYSSNLISYASKLADAGFCADRSISSGVGYSMYDTEYNTVARNFTDSTASPRLNISAVCSNAARDLFTTSSSSIGNKALTYPIGLITRDEARYAGMVFSAEAASKYNYANYLKFNDTYWTISPIRFFTMGWDVVRSGSITAKGNFVNLDARYEAGVRPSISLKSDTGVTTGSGTYDNPYVIQ